MENKEKAFDVGASKTQESQNQTPGRSHNNISLKRQQQKFKLDFSKINEEVRVRLPGFVLQLLPHGRKEGNEWLALNPTRFDRHIGSFHVNLQTLQFYDFATGEGGTGAIALYAYINRISLYKSAKELSKKIKGNKHD